MANYLFILIGTVFVNNIVVVKVLGLCPFKGGAKKVEASISNGAATSFVLTPASGASYLNPRAPARSRTGISHHAVVYRGHRRHHAAHRGGDKKTSQVLHHVLGIPLRARVFNAC